jgi:hypothetical protein
MNSEPLSLRRNSGAPCCSTAFCSQCNTSAAFKARSAQAGHHDGRTLGYRPARTKFRAPGLLRTVVAYGCGATGRGLPAGGRHQLADENDLLHAQEIKSRGKCIKPTLFRFSADIEAILKRRPTEGQLFPYLCTVRAGDRATEFKQRCTGLGISGVTLHCYRYAWLNAL